MIGKQQHGRCLPKTVLGAGEQAAEVAGHRSPQRAVAHDDAVDALADNAGREPAARGFNFGQLGHDWVVSGER